MIRFLALAVVLWSSRAIAGDAGAALSWTRLPGAERCIDAPELARAVEARIGAVLVTPAHAALSIEGRIAPRSGGGYRAVVAIAHAVSPRRSSARSRPRAAIAACSIARSRSSSRCSSIRRRSRRLHRHRPR